MVAEGVIVVVRVGVEELVTGEELEEGTGVERVDMRGVA